MYTLRVSHVCNLALHNNTSSHSNMFNQLTKETKEEKIQLALLVLDIYMAIICFMIRTCGINQLWSPLFCTILSKPAADSMPLVVYSFVWYSMLALINPGGMSCMARVRHACMAYISIWLFYLLYCGLSFDLTFIWRKRINNILHAVMIICCQVAICDFVWFFIECNNDLCSGQTALQMKVTWCKLQTSFHWFRKREKLIRDVHVGRILNFD